MAEEGLETGIAVLRLVDPPEPGPPLEAGFVTTPGGSGRGIDVRLVGGLLEEQGGTASEDMTLRAQEPLPILKVGAAASHKARWYPARSDEVKAPGLFARLGLEGDHQGLNCAFRRFQPPSPSEGGPCRVADDRRAAVVAVPVDLENIAPAAAVQS